MDTQSPDDRRDGYLEVALMGGLVAIGGVFVALADPAGLLLIVAGFALFWFGLRRANAIERGAR